MDNTECDEELFGVASAVISIQMLKLCSTWSINKNCFSKSEKYLSKKPSSRPKNVANCPSALWFVPLVVCRSGIWLENSLTLTMPAQPLLREHSLLFILPVCVMSLDSFSVFCGCSLTLRVVLFGPLTTSISVSCNLKLSTHSPLQKGHVHEYHKLVCITFSTKSY